MTLTFTVYGEAQPQGSMKGFVPKGWRHAVVTSDNPNLKAWRQLVAQRAQQAIAALPEDERRLLEEGVRVRIAFYLPRPKSVSVRRTAHTVRPDIDKLARACFDSMSAVVFRDDSQVIELIAGKFYAPAGTVPRVEIRVEPAAGLAPTALPLLFEEQAR